MSESERTYTAAELRAAIKEEFMSVLRPSMWMGLLVGGVLGVAGLPQQGVPAGAATGIAGTFLAVLTLFVFGWCYREGARSTSGMSRMTSGPTGELLLQRVLGVFLNLGVGLVTGPFVFFKLLFRLWMFRKD